MAEPLTVLERRVYHYLLDFLAENTYQPSVREIGRRFRIKSTKTVAELLQTLEKKGYIERQAARSRGVRLLGFSSIGRSQPVPLYARVNAGEPLLRDADRTRYLAMDRALVPTDDAFFLSVPDDGMTGRGIQTGDLVLIDPSARAREGDAVATRIGDGYVVRSMSHRGAQLVLSPTGDGAAELVLGPNDDFSVLGVIAAVVRPFHALVDADDEDDGDA